MRKIYLIGICGTGMGSLAGLLKSQGYDVAGSDSATYPPMSDELNRQGIPIFTPYAAENLANFGPDLVVVGNAIPRGNPEAGALLESKIPHISMPQALNRFFLAERDVVVISGTHGKTTTTAIMAYLLERLGADPSYFIGGVSLNFQASFHVGTGKLFVIEGDEYDTAFFDKGPKFLHYNPKHVVMTSLEFDHADIYRDLDHLAGSFEKLADIVPASGSLHCGDVSDRLPAIAARSRAKSRRYGFDAPEWRIENFTATPEGATFEITASGKRAVRIESPLSGRHNAANVAACFSVLESLGLDLAEAARAFKDFAGIKRRQEVLHDDGLLAVVDDFAHHPTAVEETVAAIRGKYPDRKLVAVFEPRSNSSMRDVFQDAYNRCFAGADETLIAPVFNPGKIKDGKILDVPLIAETLKKLGKAATACANTEEIVNRIVNETETPSVALIMSNGGFEGIHKRLIEAWRQKRGT